MCTNESRPASSDVLPPGRIPAERVIVCSELIIRGRSGGIDLAFGAQAGDQTKEANSLRTAQLCDQRSDVFGCEFSLHARRLSERVTSR